VGQPVQFINATSGEVTAYTWDFGDGTPTVTDANPTHTFNTAGNFTVTLTASGPGGSASAQLVYGVSAPAQPPTVQFSAQPASGIVGQPVQFINATSGEVTAYTWDFGDGTPTVTDANPTHTFNTAGNFTVTLTASGPGGSASAQLVYGVEDVAPPPAQPGLLDQLPIMPDLSSQAVRDRLRAIYDSGAAQGRRAGVFAVIGDDMALQNGYLDPFANPEQNTGVTTFQSIIDWYNQVDLGDNRSSFDRRSVATGDGWQAQDINNPGRSDGAVCNPGETPLNCESRLIQPAVALISVGLRDAGSTDPDRFRVEIETILQTLISNGVIPVISTIQPNPANEDQVRLMNEALIEAVRNVEAANNTTIPLYNLWRAYRQLPGSGLSADNFTPTTAPEGPGLLTPDAISSYAINLRNHDMLVILEQLRTQIFPGAAPQ
jgi:plastocyanin